MKWVSFEIDYQLNFKVFNLKTLDVIMSAGR